MKFCYAPRKFSDDTARVIHDANVIIDEYIDDQIRVTLRQLYYQFIGRDLFPDSWIDDEYNAREGLAIGTKNTDKNYKRLGDIVGNGRMAGLIDWDAIEDRGRRPQEQAEWESLRALMDESIASFRLPRWAGQENYVELWVEKDALVSLLERYANKWHIPLQFNKGYSSLSAMREAALRFIRAEENGLAPHALYVGDHDPSGEDMVRDVGERLYTFGALVNVEKIALTTAQVREHKLIPNPAKLNDSRAKAYVLKHGNQSWEVDALNPRVLQQLVDRSIAQLVDVDLMNAVLAREEKLLKQFKVGLKKLNWGDK